MRLENNKFIINISLCIIFLALSTSILFCQQVEICDNALDDDNDGQIDLNDIDCICMVIEPISLIPNPSFEEIECCPSGRAQLNCATGWIQASAPTTDLIHTCDWFGFENFPVPLPLPDGQGIMGFRDGRVIQSGNPEPDWKEYAGACLNLPLLPGTTYRFEFDVGFVNATVSPSIAITFYGAPSCGLLPFGGNDIGFGCPTNATGWVELGAVFLSGTSGWVNTKIDVTPLQEIKTIAIGPPCRATTANVSTYYFFDNLVLADLQSFELSINPVLHPCSANFGLSIPLYEGFDYQWYKEGVALQGATGTNLDNAEEGNYQVRLINETDCRITKIYTHKVPTISENVTLNVCEFEAFLFGDKHLINSGFYIDTFKNINNCDSIVNLNFTRLETEIDTVFASIFEGNSLTIANEQISKNGESIVKSQDQYGCELIIHVFVDYIEAIFPNVFTPNGDGQNDYFNLGNSNYNVQVQKMVIYDRWGSKIKQLNNLIPGEFTGWDGTYGGSKVATGVYTYIAEVVSDGDQSKTLTGTVLVLE
jgi:gliding motility-associated-like protein